MAEADDVHDAAASLVRELADRGRTLATAESCTGGWIAKAITDIAGSSAVFGCGIVSYSNRTKSALLGVAERTLSEHGAVSAATVAEMAAGAIRISAADLSVAVSGIAGPDGGTREKPVGTVWFGFGWREDGRVRTRSECCNFSGDRDAVRRLSVLHAMDGIRAKLAQ